MGKYFGTDGFRGTANIDINTDHAYKIGRFIGWYYAKNGKGKIVIGKDTRKSSYMFECALAAGITASGSDSYLLHVTTTPSVAYIVRTEDFDCGIMISASHNAYCDNGIKLINADGEKMEDTFITKIEEYLDSSTPVPFAEGENVGIVVDYSAGRNRYIAYLISIIRHSFKGQRVGLDCSNGSTWMIAKSVFDALGADTYVINNNPNGTNINLNCGSTHIEVMQKFVIENNLDAGFSFDGDADRCLAVDEKGNIIDGDLILYIYAKHLKDNDKLGNSKVVTTIMSNIGLYKAFDSLGIEYEKTDVGDKYVYENMRQNGHLIGGEQSGHIIFSKNATTGDGLLTALKIMQVMLDKKQQLSNLVSDIVIYPQILKNVKVENKESTLNDTDVQNAVKCSEERLGDDGRVLLRKSGTEPLIRVMVEAKTDEICEREVNSIISVINEKGYIVG